MAVDGFGAAADHAALSGLEVGDPHPQYALPLQGLASARPVQPVRAGVRYYSTDTGVESMSDGSAWHDLAMADAYLPVTAKAADSELLDGLDSTAFAQRDPLHLVGAAGEPGFLNGWTNWGGIWNSVGFWRQGDTIYLQGLARAGTQGTAIFYLPVGYRPPQSSHHIALSALGLGDVHVFDTGEVRHRDAVGNDPAWVSLDNVFFRRA